MNNKFINFALFLVGLIGIIIFRKDADFMLFMSVAILVISILLAVLTYDPEWGNPLESLREIRNKKKRSTNLKLRGSNKERAFVRVQNAIKNGKVFVSQEEDGIYIRLGGNENEGEAYTEEKVKIYSYDR